MPHRYPNRHLTHNLERMSENYLRQHFPISWTLTAPNEDYGRDFISELADIDNRYKGEGLIIQLKSSQRSQGNQEFETFSMKLSTFSYLNGCLEVVLFIKYVAELNEAFWVLLSDVEKPVEVESIEEEQKTFTIHLPKDNKISTINWGDMFDHVRQITQIKLNSVRLWREAENNQ